MIAAVTSYLYRVGNETDIWLNVAVWDGAQGETVSLHAALDQRAGQRLGCIVCRVLGALVERGHCAKVLDPVTVESPGAAIRAAAIMAALIAIPFIILHFL